MSETNIHVASKMFDLERDTSWMKTSDSAQRLASILLSIPYLRAGWTMAQVDYAAATRANALGTGYPLADNNGVVFGRDGAAPYAEFDGVNQYLSRADGGAANWADITGLEGFISAAQRGLTMGCWLYVNSWAPINNPFILCKTLAYNITIARALPHTVSFSLWAGGGGAGGGTTLTPSTVPSTGQWYFVAARYTPSTESKLYWGSGGPLETATNVVAVAASLIDNGNPFTIGAAALAGPILLGFPLHGRISCAWLCCGALSDAWVTCIYSQTRSIFGV